MKVWLLRIIGFVIGAGVVLAVGVGLLLLLGAIFDRHLVPRGPGWLILPIVAGISVAKIAPEIGPLSGFAMQGIVARFWRASRLARFIVIAPVFWILAVGAYVLLFEPYGYRMSSRKYGHMLKVMFFPPALLAVGYFIYSKFVHPEKHETKN